MQPTILRLLNDCRKWGTDMSNQDYASMSDDDLLASLPKREVASVPPVASTSSASTPDYSKMSDDELLAGLAPKSASAVAAPIPASEPRSLGQEIGRQVGLTARHAIKGAASLAAPVVDAGTALANKAMDATLGDGNGPRFDPNSSQALDSTLTKIGLPVPENAQERVVGDVASAMAGGAGVVGLGSKLAQTAASGVTRAVGETLATNAGMQTASAAAGAGASGLVRENGGGEGAQMVAGLAGALAPAGVPYVTQAGLRGAIRGGEAGRQRMADNIETFQQAAGTMPTLGQATQSRTIQATETGLSNIIGGAGTMVRRGEQQAQALQDSVQELTNALSPNASGTDAGQAIARGMEAFRSNTHGTQRMLYAALDKHIPRGTPIDVSNTRTALQALNEGIEGAPNLSAWFRNAKIGEMEKSLLADLELAAKAQAPAGGVMMRGGAAPGVDGATLPYESIKKLRTLVGREMSDANFTSDISRDKWSGLYKALSEDLGHVAKQAGPDAEQAWGRANCFTRLATERMEQLSSIVNRDAPEKIFRAATTGMNEGGTQITRLMKSLPAQERREVTAAVLQRMGRARPGQQNEIGDVFSSETFLTNLASMSPQARNAIFGGSGITGLQTKINLMGRMASVRREGAKVFTNPSGTASQAALMGWMGGVVAAATTGSMPALFTALAAPVGARTLAKDLTSRAFINFLAKETTANPALPATALTAAAQSSQTEEPVYTNRTRAYYDSRKQGKQMAEVQGGWVLR